MWKQGGDSSKSPRYKQTVRAIGIKRKAISLNPKGNIYLGIKVGQLEGKETTTLNLNGVTHYSTYLVCNHSCFPQAEKII